MADKRKVSMSPPPPKRARVSYEDDYTHSSASNSHEKPRSNPLYGQKNAFPGLDWNDELSYDDDADDGLQYLRMVRSEANALPSLFNAAPTKTIHPEISTESNNNKPHVEALPAGFYHDEAYIAPANANIVASVTPNPSYPEAQVSYYNLLRHRFLLLRSTLKCSPPADAIAGLDDFHPISLPPKVYAARKEWRRLVLSVDPQMVQLACMDLPSVLAVLKITARMMSDVLRSGQIEQIRRTSAWVWGLLGKCRELGELGTEEVGDIRDLGKRATKILQRMRDASNSLAAQKEVNTDSDDEDDAGWDEVATESDAGPSIEEGHEERTNSENEPVNTQDSLVNEAADSSDMAELEAAKARLQAKLQDNDSSDTPTEDQTSVDDQIHALLDMVITIVGEFFGQRDLLEARQVWLSSNM